MLTIKLLQLSRARIRLLLCFAVTRIYYLMILEPGLMILISSVVILLLMIGHLEILSLIVVGWNHWSWHTRRIKLWIHIRVLLKGLLRIEVLIRITQRNGTWFLLFNNRSLRHTLLGTYLSLALCWLFQFLFRFWLQINTLWSSLRLGTCSHA